MYTVDNTFRNELIAGNVMVANVRRGPISHAEVLARKKQMRQSDNYPRGVVMRKLILKLRGGQIDAYR